jgi:hypothetical protein
MIFSSYRKDRFVSKGFLKGAVDYYRSFGDYYMSRPWAGMDFGTPLELRVLLIFVPFMYMIHYWQVEHNLHNKKLDAAMMKRWGPSVDDVNKKLTPAEQLIVRNFRQWEINNGMIAPDHVRHRPEGCPLPTYEDVFGKGAHLPGSH